MSEFAPPTGPPPPKVPEGWKAQWNDQYKEWFFVNIYTKKSQWDKPTEPVYPPNSDPDAPAGPPPGYDHSRAQNVGPEKSGLASNNPYGGAPGLPGNKPNVSDDEALARRLQEEENARNNRPGEKSRGESDSFYGAGGSGGAPYGQQQGSPYGQGSGAPYGQQQSSYQGASSPQPPQSQSKGFLGKLLGKSNNPPSNAYPPQRPSSGGYYQQPQYGGPPQGYGGPPPQQYGGYGAPPPGYGGYPQQPMYAQQQAPPQAPQKHGLGAGGAAALGVGGGLLGGVLLGEALENHEDHEEQQAYDQGQDNGYDQGYDQGYDDGGDYGGGDF